MENVYAPLEGNYLMMIKKILFGFILFISNCSYAQVNVDSLMLIWNDASQPDTIRLEAIHRIAWYGYLFTQPDSAYYFAQKQFSFAKENNLKGYMAKALNTEGVYFHLQGDYTNALKYHSEGLKVREEMGDTMGIAKSYNNIGLTYTKKGDYIKALDYYSKSLKIKEELGDEKSIAASLNNIGTIYLDRGSYAAAIEYYTRSLNLLEQIGDKNDIAACLNNIGIIHYVQGEYETAHDYHTKALKIREELGNTHDIAVSSVNIANNYSKKNDNAKAIFYYKRSLKLNEEMGNKSGISIALNNIGRSFQSQGKYDTALYYFFRGLQISEEIGDKKNMASPLNNIGDIYYDQGHYNQALEYNKRSLQVAQLIGADVETQFAAQSLWKVYKKLGKHANALEMYELYTQKKDSIYSEETQKTIIQQHFKYTYGKKATADSVAFAKQQEITNLKMAEQNSQIKSNRFLLLTLFVSLLSGVLIALVSYRSYKRKLDAAKVIEQNNKLLEEKNYEIKAQAKELYEVNEEVKLINENLERLVKVRTEKIQSQNIKLRNYAYSNSHKVRAPLARLMGLINLWSNEHTLEVDRTYLIEKITESSIELDEIIREVNHALDLDDENLS